MSMFGFSWPWDKAEDQAEGICIENLQVENAELRSEVRRLSHVEAALRDAQMGQAKAQTEVIRLKLILARCHYRDAKTGRIGKMGAKA